MRKVPHEEIEEKASHSAVYGRTDKVRTIMMKVRRGRNE